MRTPHVGWLFLVVLALTGCTSFYRVTDPTTDKVYYTTEVKDEGGGAIRVKDAATGDYVRLQNSQISKVTEEEYETNRRGEH